jgi:hypothetical protein
MNQLYRLPPGNGTPTAIENWDDKPAGATACRNGQSQRVAIVR